MPTHSLIQRKVLAGVLVALTLNIFIGYAGWRTILASGKQSEWTTNEQAVLILLDATLGHVVDAETGARGFILTGKESFLDPYVSGMRARGQDLAVLRQLTAGTPTQRRSLDALEGQLRSAYGFFEEMVAARRRTPLILAPDHLEENKRRVDGVRTTIQEMRSEEERVLEKRIQASRSTQMETRVISVSGTLLGVFFLALAGFTINREMRKNTALEKRVERRTDALRVENANRAQIQEQLRASEEMYRLMLDSIKDYAVYMLNPTGEVASWNGGAMQLKGYETDEILGRHFACFYREADRARNVPEKALNEAVLNGRYEDRGWRVRKDGSEFWGNSVITPMYDENGALRGYSKVVFDITERKHAEDRLLESQNQLAAVIQSAMDGVITVDEQQQVVLFNATAERIFGCPASQAIGKSLDRFLPNGFAPRTAHMSGLRRDGSNQPGDGGAGTAAGCSFKRRRVSHRGFDLPG